MKKFTILTMVYQDYELFRQFIESIFHHLDKGSYERIIVIDDYSDPSSKLRGYENWLEANHPEIKIIKFDSFRRMKHYMDDDALIKNFGSETNLGHGAAFNLGISQVETDYVLYVDVDIIFLKKSFNMLNEMARFWTDSRVLAMGQLFGCQDLRMIEKSFLFYFKEKKRDSGAGGYIGPSAGAFKVQAFRDKILQPLPEFKLPYLFTPLNRTIFDSGNCTFSYPWFTNLQLLHMGRGIVRNFVDKFKGQKEWFVFCKEFNETYGPRIKDKELGSHYYGRAFLNLISAEWRAEVHQKYEASFSEIQKPINEHLIFTID